MDTKSKRNPIVAHWGVENEIIMFLINKGSNREYCHGNKIFYILELLSSSFLSVPSFYLILISERHLNDI